MCCEERKEKWLKRFGPHDDQDPPMGFDCQPQEHRHLLIVTERNWSQLLLVVWSNGPLLEVHLLGSPLKTKIEKGRCCCCWVSFSKIEMEMWMHFGGEGLFKRKRKKQKCQVAVMVRDICCNEVCVITVVLCVCESRIKMKEKKELQELG